MKRSRVAAVVAAALAACVLIALTEAAEIHDGLDDLIPEYELLQLPPTKTDNSELLRSNQNSRHETTTTSKPRRSNSKVTRVPSSADQKLSNVSVSGVQGTPSSVPSKSTVKTTQRPTQVVTKVTSGQVVTKATPKPVQSVTKVTAKPSQAVTKVTSKPVQVVTKATPKPNKQQAPQTTAKPKPERSPCVCRSGQCTCCSGPILDLFQQKACVNVMYTPEDFSFDVTMLLNNRVMYRNKLSGKNPPPACITIPRLTNLKLCAKFSNIYFTGRNLHMCMGMEGVWDYYELFSFSFDCVRMGANGIAVVKPEEGGIIPGVIGGVDAIIDSGDDIDDYDENVVRSAD